MSLHTSRRSGAAWSALGRSWMVMRGVSLVSGSDNTPEGFESSDDEGNETLPRVTTSAASPPTKGAFRRSHGNGETHPRSSVGHAAWASRRRGGRRARRHMEADGVGRIPGRRRATPGGGQEGVAAVVALVGGLSHIWASVSSPSGLGRDSSRCTRKGSGDVSVGAPRATASAVPPC
jgi:hypothetical protein